MARSSQRELLEWLRTTRGAPREADRGEIGAPARHPEIAKLQEDLRWLGIRRRLRFVWSADGSGVEEDSPTVIHILRSLVRADRAPAEVHAAAERVIALDLGGVARHEVGHSLLFLRPKAARTAAFRRLFGDVRVSYRVGHPVAEVERRMRRGGLANPRYRRVVSLYASTHPHERFAEAVRVALAYRGDESELAAWARAHAVAPIVLEQLLWAGRFLRDY